MSTSWFRHRLSGQVFEADGPWEAIARADRDIEEVGAPTPPEPAGQTPAELPGNFPGRAALVAAGHTTLEAVLALSAEQLAAVPDLDAEKLAKVSAALEKARTKTQV